MVPHAGTATRTWREIVELGNELASLDAVIGTRISADVALVVDWESWWALELPSKPSHDVTLRDQLMHWYRPLWERNVAVDFVHPEGDLARYRLVVAPNLYLVTDAAAANLERFASSGGTFVLSFFSGIVDEHDQIRLGGYPAPFRELLGVVVPEFWPHADGETRQVRFDGTGYTCELWSDWIELEGAEAVAVFEDGWLSGQPAVTRNGSAWYVGTRLEAAGMDALVGKLIDEVNVEPPLAVPPGVEVVRREADDRSFLFLLNHNAQEVKVEAPSGAVTLEPYGVVVLQ
jgi:beta-galactosidase